MRRVKRDRRTTPELCDTIVATTYDTLTPEAITAARRLVLDAL